MFIYITSYIIMRFFFSGSAHEPTKGLAVKACQPFGYEDLTLKHQITRRSVQEKKNKNKKRLVGQRQKNWSVAVRVKKNKATFGGDLTVSANKPPCLHVPRIDVHLHMLEKALTNEQFCRDAFYLDVILTGLLWDIL